MISSTDFYILAFALTFFLFYFKKRGWDETKRHKHGVVRSINFVLDSFFWRYRNESILLNGQIEKQFIGLKISFIEKEFVFKRFGLDKPQENSFSFLAIGLIFTQIFTNVFDVIFWALVLFVFGFRIVRKKEKYLWHKYIVKTFKIEAYLWALYFEKEISENGKIDNSITFYWVYTFDSSGRDWKNICIYETPKIKGGAK
jgi:hypothetical protein